MENKKVINILFIVPRRNFRQEYLNAINNNNQGTGADVVSSAMSNPVVPYGILSITSYIRLYSKNEINVKVIDFNILDCDFTQIETLMEKTLADFVPDIVGIAALFTPTYDSVKYYSDIIKGLKPDIITVAGGACATNEYAELLAESDNLDAICYAEGEIPFLHLVDGSDMRAVLENDDSWITRKSLERDVIPQATMVENLDEIPFIDYTLIDVNLYKNAMDFNTYKHGQAAEENVEVYLPIHTTRGCPFNCVFCAAASVHGKKMRYMSSEYVIQNIKEMIKTYGMTHLTIEDDQFLVNKKRAKEILRGILGLEKKINLCTLLLTASFVDDEIVSLFKELGIKEIPLAMEHGSERMLRKIIDKPFSVQDIKNAVATIKRHDLSVTCSLVIGLPGEEDKDRDETIALIKEIDIDWTTFNIATPFKGSRLYDICVENDYVTKLDIKNADLRHAIIKTPEMDPEYITKKVYMMNLELNFVNNYRLRIGDFEAAKIWFKKVLKKYPTQAFAHYYLAKAYEGMGESASLVEESMNEFEKIIANSPVWMAYAKQFGLK